METYLLFSRTAAAADFATDHPVLNSLISAMTSMGDTFGSLAEDIYKLNISLANSKLATSLEALGASLVTFFMVLEIVSFCFNVDFHAGFESGLKIGVRMVLMYIIIENCMSAADAVIGLFKMEGSFNFSESFKKVSEGFKADDINLATEGFAKYTDPIIYGFILCVLILVIFCIFSFLIISMIGIVAETTILTAIAPIACATLVNGQLRQTGITFLKNLAAISMQWGVIALCFDVYEEITNKINFNFTGFTNGMIIAVFNSLAPIFCIIALATMISKSGDITKRALGV